MSNHSFSNKLASRAIMGLMGISMAGLLVSCNSHPVSFTQTESAVEVSQDRSPDSAKSVDILWMIDNSGSMCEVQTSIRENFREFIDQITDKNIDFQLGVTTTDMVGGGAISRPGYLQARPQPIPTSYSTQAASCKGDEGDPGDLMDGFKPVRTNIEIAIGCSKDPSQWQDLKDVSDDEIIDAYKPSIAEIQPYMLFPTTPNGGRVEFDTPEEENPYRPIAGDNKLVLHSEDYRDESGVLDVEAMQDDFGCMSLVGTTGTGSEKGLAASIHAVSPQMTGGTVENPLENGEEAPNHGLLRDAANFALVLVTDENDCSDYGLFGGDSALENTTPFKDENGAVIDRSVKLDTACVGNACAIWNSPEFADSTPLISTEKLAERLKKNLSDSKGKELNEDALVVTSIHGDYKRYGESYPTQEEIDAAIAERPEADRQADRDKIEQALSNPNECAINVGEVEPYTAIKEASSCVSFGIEAKSGDRYESFLRHFSPDRVLPKVDPDNPDLHVSGLICDSASMGATLGDIGELIAGSTDECISEPPHECRTDADCPAFTFGDQAASCKPFGTSDRSYCDSGLQLRIYADKEESEKTFATLQSNPYCIPESLDSELTPQGCVVDPSHYQIEACTNDDEAISLNWVDEDYFDFLAGYRVELVYALLPKLDIEN